MEVDYKSHFYVPADDEAAQLIAAKAARQIGAKICANVWRCHRQCMVLMGPPLDSALSEDGSCISLVMNLWCDKGAEYDIDENQRSVSAGGMPTPRQQTLIVPASWVKAAGTTAARGRRMYVEGMLSATEDDSGEEGVTYYP